MALQCAQCKENLNSVPVKQDNNLYCSLECANLAAGYETDAELSYFEEEDISKNLYNDFDDEKY